MKKNLIHKLLSKFFDIRSEEASSAMLMFFYFFLITLSIYIIIPVKTSLFLSGLSFGNLPYAYLLTAALIGFVVSLNTKLLHSIKREVYISVSLVFFAVSLLVFWVLFKQPWPWLSLLFWFWEDMFSATAITQFWILVNDIYNPRQAKRLVGFLVSGGLLGGIFGALFTSLLTSVIKTENLILACPLTILFCLVIVNRVSKLTKKDEKGDERQQPKKTKKKVGYTESLRIILKSRHLLFLSGIVITSIVVATIVDFQFNWIVETSYPDLDARTAFFGVFYTGLLIFSYFLHVFSTNMILKKFGIRTALLVAPLVLFAGSIGLILIPVLACAIFLKGADRSLAHSLNQSVRELLYIPISPEVKYKAKVFIDMFLSKFAKGIAAILLVIFLSYLHFSEKQITVITLIFIALWIALGLLITKEYVNVVKKNLRIKWQDADDVISDKIDVDMTKMVFDTLQSKDRSSVLYAMNLFNLIEKEKMSPELKKIISQRSDAVRASSMDSLLGLDGEYLVPELEDSLDKESLGTQVKEIMSLDVYQEVMKKQLEKIAGKKSKAGETPRMEAAKGLGMMDPSSPLTDSLSRLLRDDSPDVLSCAIESAGKLKRKDFVPLVISRLNTPSVHHDSCRSLIAYGAKILGTLKDYLGDSDESLRLRRSIPDIMAQIGTQRAADLLSLELKKRSGEVNEEIIEAMYKMRSKNPQLQFQNTIINSEIMSQIRKSYQTLIEINDLLGRKKKSDLISDLEGNLARILKHIFELLALIYLRDDVNRAYQNISVGTKKATDYSIELLDNILKREIKEYLIPLIDDMPFEDKVKRCSQLLKTMEKDQEMHNRH